MRSILLSLRQWGLITGTVKAPTPVDNANPTASETSAIKAFEVRSVSAFMEISFRIADSAKLVLGDTRDPKAAWELLEKRFGAKQPGMQSLLFTKLLYTRWDGSGTVLSHRKAMVNLRTELADAGMTISDQCFYDYFTISLPSSLDLFIVLDDNPTYDVNLLCDKIVRYERRCRLRAVKEGRLDDSIAHSGQQASPSSKKRDRRHITCYKCGKQGHIQRQCRDSEDVRVTSSDG